MTKEEAIVGAEEYNNASGEKDIADRLQIFCPLIKGHCRTDCILLNHSSAEVVKTQRLNDNLEEVGDPFWEIEITRSGCSKYER
jgi:hypothetical protein